LEDAAAHYLQLGDFNRQQVLERRMQGALKAPEQPSFIEALASGSPTPGGGSAAAYAGALAAALVAMVGRLTVGKKKYANVDAQMVEIVSKADTLRAQFLSAVQQDAVAFDAVMAAMRQPKETEDEKVTRSAAIEAATLQAARQPLGVARLSVEILSLALDAARMGNINAISDAGSAAALARACLTGSALNVRINVHSLNDKKEGKKLVEDLQILEKHAHELENETRAEIKSRGGFDIE
jgi:glutamate formiminotransferase/formiminotetrahydrofolate cyclodeaminase